MQIDWLAYIFAFLMVFSILMYTILDGYDLGVGLLLKNANWYEKDRMIASIGPFWDANETWLILGVGLLLVAFPIAHGVILTHLYLPVALMLFGLIFRGVAFDFRAKVDAKQKWRWNAKFFYGSLLATLSQGYMLGSYITGFDASWAGTLFACLVAVALVSAYSLIGACWLIMKCEGELQFKAVTWAKHYLLNAIVCLVAVTVVTPSVSSRIFEKWFSFPAIIALLPIPITTVLLAIALYMVLRHMPLPKDRYAWLPFALTIAIYIFSFAGLAYSFFPFIVPEKLTIVEAAASSESLFVILIGAIVLLPILLVYTVFSYYVFHGKATALRYD